MFSVSPPPQRFIYFFFLVILRLNYLALLWILHGALLCLCVKADSLHWALHICLRLLNSSLREMKFHVYLHQIQFAKLLGYRGIIKNMSGLVGSCLLISDLDIMINGKCCFTNENVTGRMFSCWSQETSHAELVSSNQIPHEPSGVSHFIFLDFRAIICKHRVDMVLAQDFHHPTCRLTPSGT